MRSPQVEQQQVGSGLVFVSRAYNGSIPDGLRNEVSLLSSPSRLFLPR